MYASYGITHCAMHVSMYYTEYAMYTNCGMPQTMYYNIRSMHTRMYMYIHVRVCYAYCTPEETVRRSR